MNDMNMADEGASSAEERDDTFFLPAGVAGDAKPGDTLTFTVVGKDKDGNTEVEQSKGEKEGEDWKSDMRKTVAAPEPPTEEGEGY